RRSQRHHRAERALRTAPVRKEPPAARERGPRAQLQEPRGVSLEAGYSTDLSVPAPAEEQHNYRAGELYIECN
ncbi:unnamed protein product, partial [Ascophyllum nodosum]